MVPVIEAVGELPVMVVGSQAFQVTVAAWAEPARARAAAPAKAAVSLFMDHPKEDGAPRRPAGRLCRARCRPFLYAVNRAPLGGESPCRLCRGPRLGTRRGGPPSRRDRSRPRR